ncbi:glycosyltransferase [Clostridium felsineum]|uniref:glycosyltransferase n=1 Tax=Clostridium felsineum TaxID=36839 RepID=UPI00214DAEDC|nr:glycosyltransferase [Clostridium felsineum]MCR3757950.1 glycosyltransferase [Clostridium felsineum]
MKIMNVVESFGGGVYSFLVDVCNRLSENNEVVLVYSKREQTPMNFKKDFDSRIKLIYLDMCRGFNITKNLKSLSVLKYIIKNEKPDIVHLHSSKAGFIGRMACRQIGFDMKNVIYNPHGFSFLQKNENKVKRYIYYILELYASKMGGSIVGCSKGEAIEAEKISRRVYNINNGINTKKIDEIIFKLRDKCDLKEITIGTVGRISFQKNPKMFNEIAKMFPKIKFIWIGDGELRKELTSSNISVTGWRKREEVISLINILDIYIMTSLWEGLPIALLEAMYLKKTCIVSNVVGNRDVIINGKSGYIVDSKDEYVDCIKNILQNPKDMRTMADCACREVINKYNLLKMTDEYLGLYKNISFR